MSRFKNYLMGVSATVLGAGLLGAVPPIAAAAVHVGPEQIFGGQVNGHSAGAQIEVGCFGPVRPGQMGHPIGGQTIRITPGASVAASAGFTGSKADRIAVTADIPIGSTLILVEHWGTLPTYGTPRAVPTGVEVPCSGTGSVVFDPKPTSATARAAEVQVAFVSIGVSALGTTAVPHITATPTDVMVNNPVFLRGTGFTPAATLTLRECSLKSWIVIQNPCLTSNSVTVHTNTHGEFKTTMKALICPAVSPPVATKRTCYIGVPHPSGVDTIALVGAARIVVSWP